MLKSFACAALLAAAFAQVPGYAQAPAQDKTVTKQNEATATFTIKAIDQATRSVTLRQANGDEDTFTVGPEVTRFNQLKVGDTIKATYHESLVFQLRKPGAPATAATTAVAGGRLKDQPGGAVGKQQTMSVTVKAVDMKVPSLTIVTPDNRTLTRKIADAKNLEGVHPGDRIDITYTQALLVAAEPAPAK